MPFDASLPLALRTRNIRIRLAKHHPTTIERVLTSLLAWLHGGGDEEEIDGNVVNETENCSYLPSAATAPSTRPHRTLSVDVCQHRLSSTEHWLLPQVEKFLSDIVKVRLKL
jgi:hypothetical protein